VAGGAAGGVGCRGEDLTPGTEMRNKQIGAAAVNVALKRGGEAR
jgi:hypothetical protein